MKILAFFRAHRLLRFALALSIVALAFFAIRGRLASASLAPFRFVQTEGQIDSIQYTRDGHLLMTVDAHDKLVTFRDSRTGDIVRQWAGGGEDTWLSDDGARVLAADRAPGSPTYCTLYDAATGRKLRQWTGRILDVLPDFSLMVTADDYHRVDVSSSSERPITPFIAPETGRVVDVATGRVRGQFSNPDFWGTRLSRDGRFLCLPSLGDSPSRLLRVPEMTPAFPLPSLMSLRVSPNGSQAFGLDKTGALHCWLLPSGQHRSLATGLTQGRWLYCLDDGGLAVEGSVGRPQNMSEIMQIRSADSARLLRTLPIDPDAYSASGRFVGAEDWDAHACTAYEVFDAQTGRRVVRLDTATDVLGQPVKSGGFEQEHLAIAPDARKFAYAAANGMLSMYDMAGSVSHSPRPTVSTDTGRVVLSFASNENEWDSGVQDAIALPGGGVAACGGSSMSDDDKQVQVWRPGKDLVTAKIGSGMSMVRHIGVSPDGALLAGSSPWGVWTLDLASGRTAETPITVGADGTEFYSPQPEGRPLWREGARYPFDVISVGSYGQEPIMQTRWDASARKIGERTLIPMEQTVKNHQYQIGQAEVSPDGGMAAVLWNGIKRGTQNGQSTVEATSAGLMDLRDMRTGRSIRTLLDTTWESGRQSGSGALGRPVFSSDGALLAVADDQGGAQIFDVASGRKRAQLSVTRALNTSWSGAFVSNTFGAAATLAFDPRGRFLAAARDDGSIYLYSLKTFLPVAQIGEVSAFDHIGYGGEERPLQWMAFDAKGGVLYGVAQNGKDVLAWDVPKSS